MPQQLPWLPCLTVLSDCQPKIKRVKVHDCFRNPRTLTVIRPDLNRIVWSRVPVYVSKFAGKFGYLKYRFWGTKEIPRIPCVPAKNTNPETGFGNGKENSLWHFTVGNLLEAYQECFDLQGVRLCHSKISNTQIQNFISQGALSTHYQGIYFSVA